MGRQRCLQVKCVLRAVVPAWRIANFFVEDHWLHGHYSLRIDR
jgi:hypothetical protein